MAKLKIRQEMESTPYCSILNSYNFVTLFTCASDMLKITPSKRTEMTELFFNDKDWKAFINKTKKSSKPISGNIYLKWFSLEIN